MTRFIAFAVCALMGLVRPDFAAAQSINPALDRLQRETQVAAAVTVPLGRAADKRQTAPRFEVLLRNRMPDTAPIRQGSVLDHNWQERRIGLTFDTNPTVLINGAPLPESDRRDGVSTLGWVAIGVGALGALAVFAAVSLDDSFDDLGDGLREAEF